MKRIRKIVRLILTFNIIIFFIGCSNNKSTKSEYNMLNIKKVPFGSTTDGIHVEQYIMQNRNGMVVGIITYGGIINFLTAISISLEVLNGEVI